MAEATIPLIFPFIRFRNERFGGLIFNPYLDQEVEFDRSEAYVARMCNGHHSQDQIADSARRQFSLSFKESQALVRRAINKLNRAMAVDFFDGDLAAPPLLEIPSFPKNGPMLSAPINVIWEVTYACNLSCSHCLSASGRSLKNELGTKAALKLVDEIADAGILAVMLSGGEPFLRHDIFTILRHVVDANIRLDVATNGLLVTDSLIKDLTKLPLYHMRVSVDGIGATHDRLRGKKGSYLAACRTIRKLSSAGITVSMNITLNSENLPELDKLIRRAVELGCTGVFVSNFLPVGRGNFNPGLALSNREMFDASRYLRKMNEDLDGQLLISSESCFPFLFDRPARSRKDDPVGCAAGNTTFCIGADGTAYPCPFLRDFPLGNIRKDTIKQLWNQSSVLKNLRGIRKKDVGEPCRSCRYSPEPCGCGCRAAAYLETGNLLAADGTCFMPLIDKKF